MDFGAGSLHQAFHHSSPLFLSEGTGIGKFQLEPLTLSYLSVP